MTGMRLFSIFGIFSILLVCSLSPEVVAQTPSTAAVTMDAKQALDGLSRDLARKLKDPSSSEFGPALEEASQFVKAKIDKKTATVNFKIKAVERANGKITLLSTDEEERVSGIAFAVQHTIMLSPGQEALADKLKPGSRVKATCEIYGHMSRERSKPKLVIEGYKPVFQ